jgi:hypothetical protein
MLLQRSLKMTPHSQLMILKKELGIYSYIEDLMEHPIIDWKARVRQDHLNKISRGSQESHGAKESIKHSKQ